MCHAADCDRHGLWSCRAEATDVANAVLDGVDAMLLGAETLRGGYPVETLQTVLSICRQAEVTFDYTNHFDFLMSEMLMADMDTDIESEIPIAGDTPSPPLGISTLPSRPSEHSSCEVWWFPIFWFHHKHSCHQSRYVSSVWSVPDAPWHRLQF